MVIITGPQIYTAESVLPVGSIVIKGKQIHSISSTVSTAADALKFPSNYHLVPGFIDVHIHGAHGADVMDGTATALTTISQALAAEGTTSYLATTMTASSADIESALINVGHYIKSQQHKISGAKILGAHLEGPFISPQKAGAQNGKNVLMPQSNYIRAWQEKSDNAIKLVTIAPELAGSIGLIRYLQHENIIASIGHTDATYAETCHAIEAGCSHFTHLFNAMRGIHQREPGPVMAALLADHVTTELIVDGVHLHPAMVQFAIKAKGKGKVILVTDAMRAKCLKDGAYDLGGQVVQVKQGIASLADGTLAGSTLKMFSAIQNVLKFTNCDLHDAVKFAAENPAKMLNIFQDRGSLQADKYADLVVLDDQLNVVLTMVEGEIVFNCGF